jgi:hypothetical protein
MNVLKCFLSRGVDIDVPNARLHTPLDLTTEKNTKDLIISLIIISRRIKLGILIFKK